MTAQPSLFDRPEPPHPSKWRDALLEIMRDGQWHSIAEIARRLDYHDTGAAARIRDLRKRQFGSHTIERKPSNVAGVYLYRLVGKAG